ncbi:hypothetical protein [Carboxylicivirga sp. M1479]|nr:hypothetical protein [Carboxylicivirga sp. M1479]
MQGIGRNLTACGKCIWVSGEDELGLGEIAKMWLWELAFGR